MAISLAPALAVDGSMDRWIDELDEMDEMGVYTWVLLYAYDICSADDTWRRVHDYDNE